MKIQDVEINSGSDRATIRFYENENNLTPDRFENGYRNCFDSDVEHLLLEEQIQNDSRAKVVCIQMQNDGAQYLTLNSEI